MNKKKRSIVPNNSFKSRELVEKSVSYILEHTAADGKTYQTKFYNLDATKKIFPGEYDISV